MEETKTTLPILQRAAETSIEGQNQRENTKTVRLDLEAYMPLLEDTDIPDDEKLELLQALYAIMASFVDLGFSLAQPCGKPQKEPETSEQALRDHVYSSHHTLNECIENAACSDKDAAGEGVKA